MYRTDFVKFEFRLHWEMRKSDSSYGDHGSLGLKNRYYYFLFVFNLCGKTAVDKIAWVKPCHRSKVKLPYD